MSEISIELVTFSHEKMIKWFCYSNSAVHHKIAFSEEKIDLQANSSPIPRIGETIIIDSSGYKGKVIDVIYTLRKPSFYSEVKVILEPEIVYVSYYDYMKTYTHCEDRMKYKNPINDEKKYKAVFPETFDEWENDILELKDIKNKSEQWLEEAANRRCIVIE